MILFRISLKPPLNYCQEVLNHINLSITLLSLFTEIFVHIFLGAADGRWNTLVVVNGSQAIADGRVCKYD